MKRRSVVIVFLAIAALALVSVAWAQFDLGGLLKVGGSVVVAEKLGPQIDRGLNQVLGSKNLKANAATKVVTILSLGSGARVGLAQVTGPKSLVDRVKAVGQIEAGVSVLGSVRAKILIPINAKSITNVRRVNGVGVSAVIDIKL
ncbi:MAG: hypothetical protein IT210_23480 [Armatimonadetes bacterium]|nr:hypothetical protein [Armatimonadota bacterium]